MSFTCHRNFQKTTFFIHVFSSQSLKGTFGQHLKHMHKREKANQQHCSQCYLSVPATKVSDNNLKTSFLLSWKQGSTLLDIKHPNLDWQTCWVWSAKGKTSGWQETISYLFVPLILINLKIWKGKYLSWGIYQSVSSGWLENKTRYQAYTWYTNHMPGYQAYMIY